MERPARLVLRPAPGPAAAWAFAGVVLLAAGVWLVVDSEGAPLSWVAVSIFGAVAVFFLLQALVPSWFTLVCDQEGIRGRAAWRSIDARWDEVLLATLETFAGDPLLRLHVGAPHPEVIDLLLPVGTDLTAVHDFLRDRLGPSPARTVPTTERSSP